MATKRRTAKITKPYEPTALFRVYDKSTGACLGYLAPSRDGKAYYQVTCDDHGHWHCTCPATVENCCHVKAAQELCAIRVQRGQPGCFQGKAEAGVETAKQAEQSAYDLVADLIDPQLPEPVQTPEEMAAAAREELAALEQQLAAMHAKEIQASRQAAGREAIASDVITNGSIDFAQERVEATKQAEARRENAPLNGRGGFSILRAS